jgi:hypothetical protein
MEVSGLRAVSLPLAGGSLVGLKSELMRSLSLSGAGCWVLLFMM